MPRLLLVTFRRNLATARPSFTPPTVKSFVLTAKSDAMPGRGPPVLLPLGSPKPHLAVYSGDDTADEGLHALKGDALDMRSMQKQIKNLTARIDLYYSLMPFDQARLLLQGLCGWSAATKSTSAKVSEVFRDTAMKIAKESSKNVFKLSPAEMHLSDTEVVQALEAFIPKISKMAKTRRNRTAHPILDIPLLLHDSLLQVARMPPEAQKAGLDFYRLLLHAAKVLGHDVSDELANMPSLDQL